MTIPAVRQAPALGRITPLTAVVAVLATGLWIAVPAGSLPVGTQQLWVTGLLVGGFVLADLSQVHVEVRRQTVSLSLSEIPLVLGLFLVDPLSLLAARLLASLVIAGARRDDVHKATFNLALFSAEVAAAALLFTAVAGPASAGPRSWLAAYVATLGAALLTGTMVCLAIARTQGRVPRHDVVLMLAPLVVGAQLSTTGALVALVTVGADDQAVVLLVALLLLSIGAYRGYSRLLSRHRSLAQMREFTATMSAGGSADKLASEALRHARAMLSATEAVLVLDASGRRPASARLQRGDVEGPVAAPQGALAARVRATGEGVFAARSTRDPELVTWLRQQGLRDAVIVPLLGADGVVGTLQVAQRLGETGTFGEGDRQLLQMVAVHLEIALRSEDLVDRLRYEATHDPLTGLPNRAMFQQHVLAALEGRAESDGFAVVLLDLNGFKDVNDTLGHASGDTMLREVARRLVASVPAGTLATRRRATSRSMVSPLAWPRVSLTSLNPLRSSRTTAKPSDSARPSRAARTCCWNIARLGRPVSGSCVASYRSRSTRSSLRSAISRWTATICSSCRSPSPNVPVSPSRCATWSVPTTPSAPSRGTMTASRSPCWRSQVTSSGSRVLLAAKTPSPVARTRAARAPCGAATGPSTSPRCRRAEAGRRPEASRTSTASVAESIARACRSASDASLSALPPALIVAVNSRIWARLRCRLSSRL